MTPTISASPIGPSPHYATDWDTENPIAGERPRSRRGYVPTSYPTRACCFKIAVMSVIADQPRTGTVRRVYLKSKANRVDGTTNMLY